jgi:hypothetical protein
MYEHIGVAHDGLYIIKLKKIPLMVINLDLSKACDQVSWLYLRFFLLHIGFGDLVVI